MAKKKTPSESAPATNSVPARKRAAKSRKPPAASAGPAAQPLIDTDLAAAAAVRALLSRKKLHINEKESIQEMGKETPSFKTLKESLDKPAAQVTAALGSAFGPSKSNLPTHANNQVAHNQTTGVGRVNVPRRTAG